MAWSGKGQAEQDMPEQPLAGDVASWQAALPQSFQPEAQTHASPSATQCPVASHVKLQVPPVPSQLVEMAWFGKGQAVQDAPEQPLAGDVASSQAAPPQSFQPEAQTH